MSLLVFKLIFFVIFFQDSKLIQVREKIYTVSEVRVKPQPEKGLNDFYDKWSKKVVYPKEAIDKNVQGMVFIQFIVNEDGKISEAEVKQGLGHGCDEAALKGFHDAQVLWHPGIKNDTTVKVKMVVPFAFRIMKKNNP